MTLVELLGVVCILSILISLLFPFIGKGIDKTNKLCVASNLRQIALAYASITDPFVLNKLYQAKTANEWAAILAEYTDVNNAELFYYKNDYLLPSYVTQAPQLIGVHTALGFKSNAEFLKTPLCVTVVKYPSLPSAKSTAPLAYSRGLDINTGCWKMQDGDDGGVFGAQGGFIVFLDSHVEYYSNIKDRLIKLGTLDTTHNLVQSVSKGAKAVNWRGTVWEH